MSPHGTNSRYSQGCRCDDCRAAHNAYAKARYARTKDQRTAPREALQRTLTALSRIAVIHHPDPDVPSTCNECGRNVPCPTRQAVLEAVPAKAAS